jgi:Flp pilus assembly protein TadG
MCLALFLLLNLTFGAVEFGHFFYVKHCMLGASREGARAGMVSGATDTTVLNRTYQALHNAGLIGTADAAGCSAKGITVQVTGANSSPGQEVVVSVSANWSSVGIRPLGLIGASKQVLGTTTMRKEG